MRSPAAPIRRGERDRYRRLVEGLRANDWFMVLNDFESYRQAQRRIDGALGRSAATGGASRSPTPPIAAGSAPTARSANMPSGSGRSARLRRPRLSALAMPAAIEPCPLPARLGATPDRGRRRLRGVLAPWRARRALPVRRGGRARNRAPAAALPQRRHPSWLAPRRAGGTALRPARAKGRGSRSSGHRFDPTKLLVDPYATADRPAFPLGPARLARRGHRHARTSCRAASSRRKDARRPARARSPSRPRCIYELVRQVLHDAPPRRAASRLRGTLAALREPAIIDHLKRLGVSHVELMPVAAWMDERHLPPLGLSNAWGYNPVNFFALDPRLAPGGEADLRALCASYAAGRHRRDPRHRAQPHGRERRARRHDLPARLRQRRLLPPQRRGSGPARQRHRLRPHAGARPRPGDAHGDGQRCAIGAAAASPGSASISAP